MMLGSQISRASGGSRKRKQADTRAADSTEDFNVAGFVEELLSSKCPDVYHRTQAAVDRILFEAVLKHAKGNQVEAANILGISRNTLRARLRTLGMALEKQIVPASHQAGPDATAVG